MPRVIFGDWRPDLPTLSLGNQTLLTAKNCLPRGVGYGPMPSFVDEGLAAVPAEVLRAASGVDTAGNPFTFAATEDKIYELGTLSGTVDVSRTATYLSTVSNPWQFAVFGENIFACNIREPLQYRKISSVGDKFQDVTGAPKASHMGVVKNHLVVGQIDDDLFGPVPNSIWWSAISNPLSWPAFGSDLALSVQSDRQELSGAGGFVQAVTQGSEVGAVFQETAIWRLDYVGGGEIFALDRVEPKRGLLIPNLAIPFGRIVLFCNEDGFYLFDYTAARPIGEERINRFFLADVDNDYFNRVTWAIDPDRPLFFILYPGAGNTAGLPNRCLVYNWAVDKFSYVEFNDGLEALVRALSAGESLDSLPDDNLDTFESGTSFDDRISSTGAMEIGAFDATHKVGKLNGAAVAATFETGDLELMAGRRAKVIGIRPLVNGADAYVEVATKKRYNETPKYRPRKRQNRDGLCTMKADGRYHRIRTTVPAGGFDDAFGIDIEHRPGGKR